MAQQIRQTNFSGGEFSPLLYARSDLERYAFGLRRLRNFFVMKGGAAVSRPGSLFVAQSRLSAGSPVRLVPFIYSDGQSYVLELGEQYVRFIQNGALVAGGSPWDADPATPLGLATPYSASDLERLQWAQVGDVLTLTHQSYAPKELRRSGPTTWALVDVVFSPPEPAFSDVGNPGSATLAPYVVRWPPDWQLLHAYAVVGVKVQNDSGKIYKVVTAGVSAVGPGPTGTGAGIGDGSVVWDYVGPVVAAVPTPDSDHPAREWRHAVTVTAQNNVTGEILETLSTEVDTQYDGVDPVRGSNPWDPEHVVVYPDRSLLLRRPVTDALISFPPGWSDLSPLAFNYYRGRGKILGFIGQTLTRDFVDVGDLPDYSVQPPLGTNPFEVRDPSNALVRTEKPIAVAFFEQRRIFAGTFWRPAHLFASGTGNYLNYDARLAIHIAGEALVFELASRKREAIRALLAQNRLLVFTDAAVWSVGGQETSPLDFDSIDAKVVEEIGALWLPPLSLEGSALYARAKGYGVRALVPAGTLSGYKGVDLSLISQHLFVGASGNKKLRDWAYQEDPWGLVWACLQDGTLLSLTYSPTDGTWAWARHDTEGGAYVSLCCVPEGEEDALYAVVERAGASNYHIERFASRLRRGTAEDDCCVDDGKRSFFFSPTATITGLTHLEGKEVWVVAKNNPPYGPFTVSSGTVTLPEVPVPSNPSDGSLTVFVGLKFTPQFETLDAPDRLRQKNLLEVGIDVLETRGLAAGPDFEHLDDWLQRDAANNYGATDAETKVAQMKISSSWEKGGRICLQQNYPLPVTVVGVTRYLDYGDT